MRVSITPRTGLLTKYKDLENNNNAEVISPKELKDLIEVDDE